MQPLYDLDAVRPMWQELANIGVRSLKTVEDVEDVMKLDGTVLVVINSVCGCAAGHARPGVGLALQHKTIPDHLTTVFAGVDRDATAKVREYLPGITPSSPSIALFKDGKLVYMLHRKQIEIMDVAEIAGDLITAFDSYCVAEGPSAPAEVFEDNFAKPKCSSKIPAYKAG